jgi:hypothetical protein
VQLDSVSLGAIVSAISAQTTYAQFLAYMQDFNLSLFKMLFGSDRYNSSSFTTLRNLIPAAGKDVLTGVTGVYTDADSGWQTANSLAEQVTGGQYNVASPGQCSLNTINLQNATTQNSIAGKIGTGTGGGSAQGILADTKALVNGCIDHIGLLAHFRVKEQPKPLSDVVDTDVPWNMMDYTLAGMKSVDGNLQLTVVGPTGADGLGAIASTLATVDSTQVLQISGPGASNSWDTDLGIIATGVGVLSSPASGTLVKEAQLTAAATAAIATNTATTGTIVTAIQAAIGTSVGDTLLETTGLTAGILADSLSVGSDAIQVVVVTSNEEQCSSCDEALEDRDGETGYPGDT